MATPDRTGLFVRIPAREAEKLDRAAFELKTPKQELVSGLVARYVDPSPKGLANLRRLCATGERRAHPAEPGASPSRRTITVESADDSIVMGQHSFVPNEESEVMTLADVAELLQSDEESVAALADSGELPARRIGDEWRFARRAVLNWLAQGEGEE
jgi:excisionase family DNA binding protein